eukprot:scaffold2028_cov242-Prasinococcus_capsulatus_cf.AAC.1
MPGGAGAASAAGVRSGCPRQLPSGFAGAPLHRPCRDRNPAVASARARRALAAEAGGARCGDLGAVHHICPRGDVVLPQT